MKLKVVLLLVMFSFFNLLAYSQGTGLTGHYYQDSYEFNIENNTWQNCMDFEFASWCPPTEDITWFETYKGSRIDSKIEIRMGQFNDFMAEAPGGIDPALPVSIRWKGFIVFEHAEEYLLHLGGADGLRLRVNDVNLVGTFSNLGGTSDPGWLVRPYLSWETPDYMPKTSMVNVTEDMVGKKIPVLIEFYSIGVTTWSSLDVRGITLEWECTSQEKEIVPTEQLYPEEVGTGLTGHYFQDSYEFNIENNTWQNCMDLEFASWCPPTEDITWFETYKGSRLDPEIEIRMGEFNDFMAEAPGGIDPALPVSIRWEGYIKFEHAEEYQIHLGGADGLRLRIGSTDLVGTFLNTGGTTDPGWLVRPYLSWETPDYMPKTRIYNVTADMVGKKIPILIEFYSIGVTTWSSLDVRGITLEWECASQEKEIVPTSQLYPVEDGEGLRGYYYQDSYEFNIENNTWQNCMDFEFASWCPPTEDITWFETYMGSRVDPEIEVRMGEFNDFMADAPGGIDPALPVSIRWEGYIKFEHAEEYLLHIGGADGLRLRVNDVDLFGTFLNLGGTSDPGWLVRPYLSWETPDYMPKTALFNVTGDMIGKKIPILIEFYSIGVTTWSSLDVRGITLEWECTSQEKEIVPTTQLYPAALKHEVTFTVTDGTEPVAGAEVTIDGMDPLTTDESGVATVLLANGAYLYSVSADGYEDVTDAALAVTDADVDEDVVLDLETSIPQLTKESVSIYPNPANDQLYIKLADNSPDTYSIKMTTITGAVVKDIVSSDNITTIDVRDYSTGIYFISISNSKGTIVKKVIVK